MNIRTAVFQQINSIPELTGRVDFNMSPELENTPRVVYSLSKRDEERTLEGATGNHWAIFNINLYCKNRDDLFSISEKLRNKLLSCLGATIGGFYIQSVNLDMRDLFESTVNLHRAVFEFEIYY